MRPALSKLLFDRNVDLYRDRPLTESLMGFGFECGDGWFAVLDALGEALAARAVSSGSATQASQVKEKYGTLSFYVFGADRHCSAAIDLAEAFSARVCELTGAQGELLSDRGWYATRAPGSGGKGQPARLKIFGREVARLPSSPSAAADLAARWMEAVPGGIDVPVGWADLVDATLSLLAAGRKDEAGPPALSVGRDGSGKLFMELGEAANDEDRGAVAFAVAMAERIDPVTGASGPVDDEGMRAPAA